MQRRLLARAMAACWVCLSGGCHPDADLFDEGRSSARPPDARGDPPAEGPAARPAGPDTTPPAISGLMVSLRGDCVRVQLQTDEPATVTAVVQIGAAADSHLLGSGASLFDLAFRPAGLAAAGSAATLLVDAIDRGGNRASADPTALRLPAPGGSLVIAELMVNPVGSENTQEWIELANLGGAPVTLAGLSIADDGGSDALPPGMLAPGARALIVGASFDEASAVDTPPRAGTLLLRVPGRIGRDGLRQAGEVVQLLAPGAAGPPLLSSYGGWVDTARAAWSGHSIQRLPDETACDHPASWSPAPQIPTPGW